METSSDYNMQKKATEEDKQVCWSPDCLPNSVEKENYPSHNMCNRSHWKEPEQVTLAEYQETTTFITYRDQQSKEQPISYILLANIQ